MNKVLLVKAFFILSFVIGSFSAHGQQDPMYTQYIFNLQTVNPAYAGSWQTIGLTAMTRLQWIGMNGHPSTETFSFQSPLKRENVGVGLNFIHDEYGLEKRLSLSLDYSYNIHLTENTSLRLGVKGGFTSFSNNLYEYQQYPDNIQDPLFQSTINNKFMPNFGVGFYLSSLKYYLSLSAPRLLVNNYQTNINNYSTKAEVNHFYFARGLLFDLSGMVKFKPTFMTQAVQGAPLVYDLSANFLFAEKFWLGGMVRSGDAIGAIAQWIINKKFRIGYAYDFTTTNLRNYQNGVHEIMLSYELVRDKQKIVSPRYF
jgi:type IX secretion system PorP/SprF family membrane protein